MTDPVYEKIVRLKPKRALEIGCGYGDFTVKIAPHCGRITAIELHHELVDWCQRENSRPNIDYQCMDGRRLDFPGGSFDLAFERSSLHHILDWHPVVDEMVRVSSHCLLFEEPVDDARSPEKVNAIKGQELLLELQSEVGYPHFNHLNGDALQQYLAHQHLLVDCRRIQIDDTLSFDQFFHDFETFAQKSWRCNYWQDRLEDFRNKAGGQRFAHSDLLFIIATK